MSFASKNADSTSRTSTRIAVAALLLSLGGPGARAAQIDISGPNGASVHFGASVTALPNGNIVIVDPNGPVSNVGAVYLYGPTGAQISHFTGSSEDDEVGYGGVVVVGDSNFVVLSPYWKGPGGAHWAGAATWVNGATGLSGIVSASNSLVGTMDSDQVGSSVTVLNNGNYVVTSPDWKDARGAATWANGNTGLSGAITAQNSLTGSSAGDAVGLLPVTALSNGNYVVASPQWNGLRGAATWGNGLIGRVGTVTASNSLVGPGLSPADQVGYSITPLNNGNYVVRSPYFNGNRGAATWASGMSVRSGSPGPVDSLVGPTAGDQVSMQGIIALSNGNFVVASSQCLGGRGAATFGSGTAGVKGFPAESNSLTGANPSDYVGTTVAALTNYNYVVGSPNWNGGRGAVTWANGTTGMIGTVSVTNSIVGTNAGDHVGASISPLRNGNYVAASTSWNSSAGAATWGSGFGTSSGVVSALNSLVGAAANDLTGYSIAALSNGSYVVTSYGWNGNRGAATWANGITGLSGVVSGGNSLVGNLNDHVGLHVDAVGQGNYVVASPAWDGAVGAITWGNGARASTGIVGANNSLVGSQPGDLLGNAGVTGFGDGTYAVRSLSWNNAAGAITFASGAFRLRGTIQHWNSVEGSSAGGGSTQRFSYDLTRHRIVVGRPNDNIVSIFTLDQVFADTFE